MTTSETLTYAIFQSTLIGVGLLDHKNKLIEVNDTFCRIYGYSKQELIGQSLSTITPSDYRERASLLYQDYVKGYVNKGLKQIRRRDGSWATVYMASENMEDKEHEQFKLIHIVEVPDVEGVSDHKEEIRESKPISDNTNIALLRCSSSGNIVFANDAARSLLFLPQGYKHLNTQVFVFSGNIHRELSLMQLLTEKPSFENMELLLARPDESRIWTYVSSKPIIIEGMLHYDISVINIEPIKKLEKKLIAKIEELKTTNKQLDHFVYGATHDLKAPLASLAGLISVLRHENDPEQKDLYMQLMDKSIHRLNEFIKEIVDYSRNSNQELKSEKIEFRALVDEIFESLEHMSNAAEIKKIVEIDQKSPFYSDKHRLKVVLSNLISNAYKYSSTHRRDCYIHVYVQSDTKQATIHVRDNGQGISQEHIDKIFNMFFRASEGKGGTGLGLYIVKETIDKMKGNIHVVSELGKGSCFVVNLPSHTVSNTQNQMTLDI